MYRFASAAGLLASLFALLPLVALAQHPGSGSQFPDSLQSPSQSQLASQSQPTWQPPQTINLSDWSTPSGQPAAGYSLPADAPVQPAAFTEPAVAAAPAATATAQGVETSGETLRRPIPLRSGNVPAEIASPTSLWQSLVTTASALALVCGIFVAIMLLTKRFSHSSSGKLPLPVFQLLGRSQLAPRHQILLIRFGSKLILVSSEAGQTQTLAQIDNPEEVDRLAGLCQRESPDSASHSFQQIFASSLAVVGRSRAAAIALCFGLAITASTAIAQDASRFASPASGGDSVSLVDHETSIIQRLADAVEENNRLRESQESGDEAAGGDSVSDLLAGP